MGARDLEAVRLEAPTGSVELLVRRSDRARRVRLRVDETGVWLVVPRRARLEDAVRSVAHLGPWVARCRARFAARSAPPGSLLLRGVETTLARAPVGEFAIEGDRLLCPQLADASDLEAWLRSESARDLARAVERRSRETGLVPRRVSVRDQRTRWGACTSRGNVTLNWRLVLAPPAVLDYVVLHEIAHLAEFDHSPRFWAVVDRFCPEWRAQRGWLREFGWRLHRLPPLPPGAPPRQAVGGHEQPPRGEYDPG